MLQLLSPPLPSSYWQSSKKAEAEYQQAQVWQHARVTGRGEGDVGFMYLRWIFFVIF